MALAPLPPTFAETREALHRVAELIVAPARKPAQRDRADSNVGRLRDSAVRVRGPSAPGPGRRGRAGRRRGRLGAPRAARDDRRARLSFVGADLFPGGTPTDSTPLGIDRGRRRRARRPSTRSRPGHSATCSGRSRRPTSRRRSTSGPSTSTSPSSPARSRSAGAPTTAPRRATAIIRSHTSTSARGSHRPAAGSGTRRRSTARSSVTASWSTPPIRRALAADFFARSPRSARRLTRPGAAGIVGRVRIGVLTGGGDCPGLNAVIRAIVRKGVDVYGHEFVGYRDGWRGPLEGDGRAARNPGASAASCRVAERSSAPLGPTRSMRRPGPERLAANSSATARRA